jgi:hypothetical protein
MCALGCAKRTLPESAGRSRGPRGETRGDEAIRLCETRSGRADQVGPRLTRAGNAPMTVRSAILLRAASPHPGLPQRRPPIFSLVLSMVRIAEPRGIAPPRRPRRIH